MIDLNTNILWQKQYPILIEKLSTLCLEHAAATGDPSTAPQRAAGLAESFARHCYQFLSGEWSEETLRQAVQAWAEEGLDFSVAREMASSLIRSKWPLAELTAAQVAALFQQLNAFQLHFLEALRMAREERLLRPLQGTTRNPLPVNIGFGGNGEQRREQSREAGQAAVWSEQQMDPAWHIQAASLHASYEAGALNVNWGAGAEQPPTAAVQIPLIIGDQPLGYVQLPPDIQLDEDEADFVHALIREMGNALNNAQLLQATRTYSKQLQLAAEVSHAASTILDRQRLVREVVELIQRRFDFYYVALFFVDDDRHVAVLHAGSGQTGQAMTEEGFELPVGGRSMVGTVAATGRPRVERNIRQAQDYYRNPLLPDTQSEMALPLQTGGVVFGVLTIQSSEVDAFSNEDLVVFQTLVDQLTTAFQNAALFAQRESALQETARLYQTSGRLTRALNEDAVYQVLVEFAADSDLADGAQIVVADPSSSEHFTVTASWYRTGSEPDQSVKRLRRDQLPLLGQTGESRLVWFEAARNDSNLREGMQLLYAGGQDHAGAVLAIQSDEHWLGALILHRATGGPLTEAELQPFLTLTEQAAIILANQQFLRQTDALYRVSRVLNHAITREDAVETVITEVTRLTGVQQCRFILFERSWQHGRVIAESQPSDLADQIVFSMAANSLYARLNKQQQPLLVSGADSEPAGQYLSHFGLRSALLIPAISQQELLGFLALDNVDVALPLSRSKLDFVQNILDQLTTSIESLKLFDDAMQRAQELVTLNQIGSRISGTLDLPRLAEIVYQEVSRLVDDSIFVLARFDPQKKQVQTLLAVRDGEVSVEPPRRLDPDDPLHQALYAGRPLLVHDPEAIVPLTRLPADEGHNGHSLRSWLLIPIRREEQPIGFLSVQSFRHNAYNDNDLQLLRTIATQTGLAVSNATLFRETQNNVAELRELFRITQAAASSIDTRIRIENIAQALNKSLRGAHVAILMVDQDGDQLISLATHGRPRIAETMPLDASLIGRAVRLRRPLRINDLRQVPGYDAGMHDSLSQLVVPLNLGQRSIGAISAESSEVGAFGDRDLRLLQTVSASLAATIESGRLFEAIQAANERLRELDRLKTQFLANMSHELRTPLNSIIGFSRIMLKGIDGPITEMQEEDLNSIHSSGQHLLGLINEILDLAKIEAGRMTLVFESVDLGIMATDLLATSRGLVQGKNVELVWDIERGLPLIEADPVRLRQILLNFLSNAAKFTEQGTICLQIQRDGGDQIHIQVADTGIGIAEKDFPKLFEAFQQVDASPTRATGGTGLGLSITQRLIHMHRGEVWFESKVGQGTTFHVTLPVRQHERPADTAPLRLPRVPVPVEQKPGRRSVALIVDDEPGIIDLYKRYLRDSPFQPIGAHSGREALEKLAEEQDQVAIILLDVNMPGINGWELLSTIRRNPATATIPVIICSIDADHEKAAEIGAQMLLPKPILEEDLLVALETITNQITL